MNQRPSKHQTHSRRRANACRSGGVFSVDEPAAGGAIGVMRPAFLKSSEAAAHGGDSAHVVRSGAHLTDQIDAIERKPDCPR